MRPARKIGERAIDRSTYAIFVNSTDSFEDTWRPFFHLLGDFWPQEQPVVLNTERKSFAYPGVPIICTQVARAGEARISWSECMIRALDTIPTEEFVYLQDDYFLYASVDTAIVDEAVDIVRREGLDCLRLVECGEAGPYEATSYPWLCSVSRTAHYRISLQAAVWTKTGMRKYLRAHESPWELEVWGSKRASRIPGRIWAVDRDVYSEEHRQLIPYVPTGIVRGKWKRDVVELLFAEHGIEVPFEVRGWLPPEGPARSTFMQKVAKAPKFAWDRMRSL